MAADLIVARRYLEGGVEVVEEITWRHVPDPGERWRWVRRRFRSPKLVPLESGKVDGRGRALPEWCAPGVVPNRWLWVQASRPAADLEVVAPDAIDGGTRFFLPGSSYWDYYGLPLRAGVRLLSDAL
jgi:hypothetical protein